MIKTEAKNSTICAYLRKLQYIAAGAVFVLVGIVTPVAGVFLFTRGGAQAATSSTLNFQARLLDGSGSVVADGTYNVQFNLYTTSSGGSTQWTETYLNSATQGVTVKYGYMSVSLGSLTAFPSTIDWDQEQWLGMTVRGTGSCSFGACTPTDSEMTPRFKLTAVPYAFKAGTALGVASNNTNAVSTNSGNVSIVSGNAAGATSNSGNITVDSGTATGTAGSLLFGTTNASALTIGRAGVTTTLQGSVSLTGSGTALSVTNDATIGGTLGVTGLITASGGLTVTNGDTFTNAGATLNTTVAISNLATGGAIGTAAGTVDAATAFNITQTTASQTLSLPTPTNAAAGRIVYVNNVGSASFTMHGSVIAAGASNAFMWNGTSWVTTVSLSGSVVNSIGTIDSQTKSADGAVIASNALYLQTADASFAGLVSTGTQTFAGNKTFNGSVSISAAGTGLSVTNDATIGGNLTVDTSTFFVDATNNRVGIGSSAPQSALEVVGNVISKGTSWTARTSAANNTWNSIAYGNGLFVAVSADGTGNRVMTSPDGVNWTIRSSAADNGWRSVTYGNGLFVAVANSGTGNRVMTSSDGVNWVIRSSAANQSWNGVTYGNGTFVAVADDGTASVQVMTSSDGVNWVSRTAATASTWRSVTYGNGLFVAVSNSGAVMTSPTGTTWSTQTAAAANIWYSVTYGNGLFVATSTSGTGNRVMTSPDGVNWTSRSSAADLAWYSVTYGNGLFVAVAGDSSSNNAVMTSPDGINWVTRTTPNNNAYVNVTYGNGVFVAIAQSGTGNRVMSSGVVDRIPTSENNIYQGGITVNGSSTFKSDSNSTTAFQVLSSTATSVFNVDTTNGRVGIGTASPNASLQVSGNQTAGGFSTGGMALRVTGATYTDSSSPASSTQTIAVGTSLGIPTFAATNSSVTYTNAATLYISDAPAAGTNVTLTNRYALYVASGASIFGGNVQTSGNLTVTSGGSISQTGAGTFSTGTGNISLNGAATASAGFTITSGGSFSTQRNTTDITAGGNDVNLGTGSLFRFTNGTPITLTGIANGADGRRVMLVNAGSSTVTLNNGDTNSSAANRISTGTGSAVTLPAGGSLELIYDSGASLWRVTSASAITGGYVQNQSSTDQSADFRISGTGRANTSFTTPLVDSITGALSIGTSTATGITVGGTTNTTSVALQGAAAATYTIGTSNNTGGITLGNSTATNTISLGAAAGNTSTQTINIGTSATAGSTTNVTIGSTIAGSTTLQSGTTNINSGTIATNQTTLNLFNTTTTTLNFAGAATNITLGATSGTLTVRNANTTLGNAAGSGVFTNNGATVNTTLALSNFAGGGSIGTAAATVDVYTSISINQTTAGQTLTVPTPTASTTYGRTIYVSNIGSASFTIGGSLILPGNTGTLVWSNTNGGASWQYAGDGGGSGNYIQNQNSADQTGNFRISGTGRANTSFTTPLVDSITGALSIGTSTATGVTISKTGSTTAVAGALTVAENLTVDTNTLFVDAGNNRVAIGTTDVTNGVLTIAGTAPNAANGAGLRIDTTLDSTTQNQNGMFVRPTVSPASASTRTYAALNFAAQSSSANVSGAALMGIFGGGSFSGTGTLGSAYGAYFQNYNNSTGTISDAYGVYIDSPSNAGTITRNYGQVIINQTAGSTANANLVLGNVPTTGNWSLYSQSANNSAFNGNVRIGSTSAPTVALDVTGAATVSGLVTGQLGASFTGAAVNINASSNFATNINTGTSTGAVSIGNNTGNPSVTIDSGTGAISIGTGAQNRTTNIATGGAVQTVTLGSTNTSSATTIAAGTGAITFNAATAQFSEVTGTRTLTVQTRTTGATAGTSLTIAAGAAGATSTYSVGGTLTLQGGNAGGATGSAANGGNVVINGGTGIGGGVRGLVVLGTPAFQTATVQNFTSSGTITQANVDANSAILITSNAAGYTATLGDPTITTAGRVIYVTNSGTFDMTLSVNGGGSGNTITLKPSTTATMIWNGADWTAAGASSSTDLQAAYNNTATSAGGAELVLNGVGGAADGLTVRNNATSPIIGGIFEAQTAVGANIFSVNNNALEYAVNGGAETSTNFSTNWLAAPAGGTVARNTTAAEVATGQASVSVVTTATASHGARNILSTTLTPSLRYNVSYTVKSATAGSSFTTLETMFSSDGTATAGLVRSCVAGTPTYFTGTASQSGTTITGSGTTWTSGMVGQIFVFANGASALITGFSSATSLTTSASYSQTVASQSYAMYNAGNTVKAGAWSRVSCSFTAPASGMTANNSIFIRQTDATARTFYIDNLSVTVSADVNHAVDGSVDDSTNFTTNWTAFGASTVARNTTVLYDTSASTSVVTTATANLGVRNNMVIRPSVNTQYLVTFYARSTNTFNDIRVRYSRDGGTNFVTCGDFNTQSISTTGFTRVTCLFTTDGTTATNPDLIIDQPTATARTFYIDALTVSLNTNTSNNVQIGAGARGGPVTLFTLDRAASAPIAANNDAYLGSMYYDTTTGRIQCYEADGWGACGSAPDNYVNLNPEYAGAVLNGSGVGTMTADFCANQSGVLQVNTTLCASGESRNFYRWTSPQASDQTYSIYVSYQLPATFKGFASDDTVQLTARTDNTTNGSVSYEMYKSESGALTSCGTATTVTSTNNLWQTVGVNGNEATSCNFTTASANAFVIFKINVTAKSNANVYVGTLSFTTTGR